jgi:hypothetical protein
VELVEYFSWLVRISVARREGLFLHYTIPAYLLASLA